MSITHVNNAQIILGEIMDVFETVEESNNGRAFYPTKVSTCRVMHGVKLGKLFERARKELNRPIPKTLAEINADWQGGPYLEPETLSEDFRKGAKAMFDSLTSRAANNYHGRPSTDKKCQEENKLIEEWALDALKEIAPDDHLGWVAVNEAFDNGRKQGHLEGLLEGKLSAAEELKKTKPIPWNQKTWWQKIWCGLTNKY